MNRSSKNYTSEKDGRTPRNPGLAPEMTQQEAQLSQRGRVTLRDIENLAVTQGSLSSFEIKPLSTA